MYSASNGHRSLMGTVWRSCDSSLFDRGSGFRQVGWYFRPKLGVFVKPLSRIKIGSSVSRESSSVSSVCSFWKMHRPRATPAKFSCRLVAIVLTGLGTISSGLARISSDLWPVSLHSSTIFQDSLTLFGRRADLWPTSRHLSMIFQDLWPRCWPGPCTYRRTIHLCAGCSASMSEYLIDMSVE